MDVLLISNNKNEAGVLADILTNAHIKVKAALTEVSQYAYMNNGSAPKAALIDISGGNVGAFFKFHSTYPDMPVIVMYEESEEEQCMVALKEGAQDCVRKHEVDAHFLVKVVTHACHRHEMEKQINTELQQELQEQRQDIEKITEQMKDVNDMFGGQ